MVLVVGSISCIDIFFDYNFNYNIYSGSGRITPTEIDDLERKKPMTEIFNTPYTPIQGQGQTIYTGPWLMVGFG